MKACEIMNLIYLTVSTDDNVDLDILQSIKLDVCIDIYYIHEKNKDNKIMLSENINLILEQDMNLSNKWILLKCYLEHIQENNIISISSFIEKYKKITNEQTQITIQDAVQFQTPFYLDQLERIQNLT